VDALGPQGGLDSSGGIHGQCDGELLHALPHDGGRRVQGGGCCLGVGLHQSTGAQLDATEVAHDSHQHIGQLGASGRGLASDDGLENRCTSGATRFPIVAGALGVAVSAEHEGVADVSGLPVFGSKLGENLPRIRLGLDTGGVTDEPGALDLDLDAGTSARHQRDVPVGAGSGHTVAERT